jgi:hypothetical protein
MTHSGRKLVALVIASGCALSVTTLVVHDTLLADNHPTTGPCFRTLNFDDACPVLNYCDYTGLSESCNDCRVCEPLWDGDAGKKHVGRTTGVSGFSELNTWADCRVTIMTCVPDSSNLECPWKCEESMESLPPCTHWNTEASGSACP